MKKSLLVLGLVFIELGVLLFFSNPARASADEPTYIQDTEPTAAQIVSEVCYHYGYTYHDWDYYILASPVTVDGWGTKNRYFSIALVDPSSNSDIHIINDNYDVNHEAQPFKVFSDTYTSKGVLFATFLVRDAAEGQSWDIDISYSSYGLYNLSNDATLSNPEGANILYASNMNVLVGDVNVNEQLYTCDIFYTADTSTIIYQVDNISDDTQLNYLYGIRDYQTINGGSVIPDDTSFSQLDALSFLQWCTANEVNYNNYIAFIDVYRGIEFMGSYTVDVGGLIDGGDDFYDHELPYPEAPDYQDYIDDPPPSPDMPDLPEMPTFDPEHPIDSIIDFIVWLGQLLLVPIVYIASLLKWLVSAILYFVDGSLHYLLDLFGWLIESIQVAVYNLIVKLKGLLYKLFVPSGVFLDNLIANHFPFITDLQHIFTDITFSGSTGISLSLLGHSYYFSFIDTFGTSFCTSVSALTSVYIDCVCIFTCYKAIKGLLNFAQ